MSPGERKFQAMESDGIQREKWRRVLNCDTFHLRWGLPALGDRNPAAQSPEQAKPMRPLPPACGDTYRLKKGSKATAGLWFSFAFNTGVIM